MRPRLLIPAIVAGLLAGCGSGTDVDADPQARAPAAQPVAAAGIAREPAPVAGPPGPSRAVEVMSPTYAGFGPATYGSDAEAVRQAWGRDMDGMPPKAAPGEAEGCYLLTPKGLRTGDGRPALHFMIEGGRFVRTDVRGTAYAAPGGGRVGMIAAQVEALHAGALERQPHKYVDGAQYMRVRDAASGHALVYETDAAGTVTTWRIGQVPQVDYVESCS